MVTDAGIAALSGIGSLMLRKNDLVTMDAIKGMVRRSPNIYTLDLELCANFRLPLIDSFDEFKKSHPRLMLSLKRYEAEHFAAWEDAESDLEYRRLFENGYDDSDDHDDYDTEDDEAAEEYAVERAVDEAIVRAALEESGADPAVFEALDRLCS